jgi:DNA-3-methyladenine glycosylase
MNVLPQEYFLNENVVDAARKLLGKTLHTHISGVHTSGIITETEAYNGIYDKACHAYDGKRTKRTSVMYQKGGISYVYLCYGIHNLFNVITNKDNIPDAVLIRAIKPLQGIPEMLKRRGMNTLTPKLTTGPGRLTQALGINREHNGVLLNPDYGLWIQDNGDSISDADIDTSARIGISYAAEHADLPWRFFLKNTEWVSSMQN